MDRRYRKRMTAYWARAESRGRCNIDRLDLSSWFDHWHIHVDVQGRGNTRPENRLDVATATISLLKYLEQRTQARLEPLQVWAVICTSTGDNAVYVHSPNPNGAPYPNEFRDVQWGAPVPEWVSAVNIDSGYEVGVAKRVGECFYIVRRL